MTTASAVHDDPMEPNVQAEPPEPGAPTGTRLTRRQALRMLGTASVVTAGVLLGIGSPPEAEAATAATKMARAVRWAKSKVGSSAWGTGARTECERFVENAFGTSGRYATAYAGFRAIGRYGRPSKPGQIVFFARNASNGYAGHAGIWIGGDQMVSVTTRGVQIRSVSGWSRSIAPLLGYAFPPDNWPGV